MKRLAALALMAVTVAAITIPAMAQAEKVTICHATGSDTNPWVEVTAAYNAIYGQSGHFNEPGSPAEGHEQDYEGPCQQDTTTTTTTEPTSTTTEPTSTTTTVTTVPSSSTTTTVPTTTTIPITTTSQPVTTVTTTTTSSVPPTTTIDTLPFTP